MKGSKGTNAILKNAVWGLCALLFLFVFWWIAYLVFGDDFLLPSPWAAVVEAFRLLGQSGFWTAFGETFLRSVLAFAIAAVLAAAFVVVSYLVAPFRCFCNALCALLRSLPTMAVLLILLVLFRRAFVPVVVGVITLLPVMYTGYSGALFGVDKDLVEMSKTFGVSKKKIVTDLYLPSMKNLLISESAAGLSFALKLIVSAEILASVAGGLGGQMQEASDYLQTATLFALTLVVCAVGIVVEWAADLFVKEGV